MPDVETLCRAMMQRNRLARESATRRLSRLTDAARSGDVETFERVVGEINEEFREEMSNANNEQITESVAVSSESEPLPSVEDAAGIGATDTTDTTDTSGNTSDTGTNSGESGISTGENS